MIFALFTFTLIAQIGARGKALPPPPIEPVRGEPVIQTLPQVLYGMRPDILPTATTMDVSVCLTANDPSGYIQETVGNVHAFVISSGTGTINSVAATPVVTTDQISGLATVPNPIATDGSDYSVTMATFPGKIRMTYLPTTATKQIADGESVCAKINITTNSVPSVNTIRVNSPFICGSACNGTSYFVSLKNVTVGNIDGGF